MIIGMNYPDESQAHKLLKMLSQDAIDFLLEAMEADADYGIVSDNDVENLQLLHEVNDAAEEIGIDPVVIFNAATLH